MQTQQQMQNSLDAHAQYIEHLLASSSQPPSHPAESGAAHSVRAPSGRAESPHNASSSAPPATPALGYDLRQQPLRPFGPAKRAAATATTPHLEMSSQAAAAAAATGGLPRATVLAQDRSPMLSSWQASAASWQTFAETGSPQAAAHPIQWGLPSCDVTLPDCQTAAHAIPRDLPPFEEAGSGGEAVLSGLLNNSNLNAALRSPMDPPGHSPVLSHSPTCAPMPLSDSPMPAVHSFGSQQGGAEERIPPPGSQAAVHSIRNVQCSVEHPVSRSNVQLSDAHPVSPPQPWHDFPSSPDVLGNDDPFGQQGDIECLLHDQDDWLSED